MKPSKLKTVYVAIFPSGELVGDANGTLICDHPETLRKIVRDWGRGGSDKWQKKFSETTIVPFSVRRADEIEFRARQAEPRS